MEEDRGRQVKVAGDNKGKGLELVFKL